MVTRLKKAGDFRYGIAEQAPALLALDNAHFGRRNDIANPVAVDCRDGVAESEQQTATTLDLVRRAGAVSTKTKVKILHPEWDDGAIEAEVAAILAETGASAPDPDGSFPM